MRILTISFLFACLCVFLSACSSIPRSKPEAPTVTVTDVYPVSLGITQQTIGLTLRIANPNSFDLPMQSLSFNAHFSGERFAQGQSVDKVIVPGEGEAELNVEVTAGLGRIAKQIKNLLNSENPELKYDVTGLVKLSNWPKAIPFNVEGTLEELLESQ